MNNVFNQVREFIFSPELEDLNVFSKQYLNSVIKPYYSSNIDDDNYVSICIDFDKLNDINNLYDYQTGNRIIYDAISLIQSVLPNNSICSRIGGDEFLFLIPDCSFDAIDNIINRIHSILKLHENDLLHSSVTAYGVHSSEKDNLSEMIAEADLKITDIKNNFNKNSSYSKWGILEQKLTQNLTSFFKSLRLYKQSIDLDFLKKLYVHAISSSSDLLEKDFSVNTTEFQEQNSDCSFNENELEELYSIFLKKHPTEEEINKIPQNTYSSLLDDLIHDPVTGNFTKDYFTQHLLRDNNGQYQIKYFSTALIKLYNTIFSHNATDIQGQKMIQNLTSFLEDELNIKLVDENFTNKSGDYFIALGAGDYVLATKTPTEEINDKINQYISSRKQDFSQMENILRLTCSQDFHTINEQNSTYILETLSNECKQSKDDYKIEMLNEIVIKDIISSIICDSSEYYIDNIPKSNDIKQKSKFLNLVSKIMIDISSDINNEQNLKDTNNDKNNESYR